MIGGGRRRRKVRGSRSEGQGGGMAGTNPIRT